MSADSSASVNKFSALNFINALNLATKEQKREYDREADDAARKQEIKSEVKHAAQQSQTIKQPLLARAVVKEATFNPLHEAFMPTVLEGKLATPSQQNSSLAKINTFLKTAKSIFLPGFESVDLSHSNTPVSKVTETNKDLIFKNNKNVLARDTEEITPIFSDMEETSSASFRNMNNANVLLGEMFENVKFIIDNCFESVINENNSGVTSEISNLGMQNKYYSTVSSGIDTSFEQSLSSATQMESMAIANAFSSGTQATGSFVQAFWRPTGSDRMRAAKYGMDALEKSSLALNANLLDTSQNKATDGSLQALRIEPQIESDLGFKPGGLKNYYEGLAKITERYESTGSDHISLREAENEAKRLLAENLLPVANDSPQARLDNFNKKIDALSDTSKELTEIKDKPLLANVVTVKDVATITQSGGVYQFTDAAGAALTTQPNNAIEMMGVLSSYDTNGSGGTVLKRSLPVTEAQEKDGISRQQITLVQCDDNGLVKVFTNTMQRKGQGQWESEKGITQIAEFQINDYPGDDAIAEPAKKMKNKMVANIRKRFAMDLIRHSQDVASFRKTGFEQTQLPTTSPNTLNTLRTALRVKLGELPALKTAAEANLSNYLVYAPSEQQLQNLLATTEQHVSFVQRLIDDPRQVANAPALTAYKNKLTEIIDTQKSINFLTERLNNTDPNAARNLAALDNYLLGNPTGPASAAGVIPRNPMTGIVNGADFTKYQQYNKNGQEFAPWLSKVGIGTLDDPNIPRTLSGRMSKKATEDETKSFRRAEITHAVLTGSAVSASTMSTRIDAQSRILSAQSQQSNNLLEKERGILNSVNSNTGTSKQSMSTASANSSQAVQTVLQAEANALPNVAR